MKIAAFVLTLCMATSVFGCSLEDGWKGIRVFKSSRADADRAFGTAISEKGGEVKYETDDAYIRVLFSSVPCSAPETISGGYNVKQGVVLQYDLRMKKSITIADLHMNLNHYKRIESGHLGGTIEYFDAKDGIVIHTLRMSEITKEIVQDIYFQRTPELNAKFSCG